MDGVDGINVRVRMGGQCLKLRFYFLHSAGAKISQLCAL